eukprot:GILJ01010591.1.p1 GENE.GILJ01010591.1~~GILJ01010591.1.p1  ORF type:complete len:129 (-),score=14.06 GILJ01010591.1:215-601(-)
MSFRVTSVDWELCIGFYQDHHREFLEVSQVRSCGAEMLSGEYAPPENGKRDSSLLNTPCAIVVHLSDSSAEEEVRSIFAKHFWPERLYRIVVKQSLEMEGSRAGLMSRDGEESKGQRIAADCLRCIVL